MKLFLSILFFPLVVFACAYPSQTHQVLVNTVPNKARIYLDKTYVGESPTFITVQTNPIKPFVFNRYMVAAKKDGYVDTITIVDENPVWRYQDELFIELQSLTGQETVGTGSEPAAGEALSAPAVTHNSTPGTPEGGAVLPGGQVSGNRFAVIVGISNYSDSRIPSLRYAASDARAFYKWIISPDGGRYAPSRVKLLLDEQATGSNLRGALFSWLKQAIEEDVVVIFFAGHGSSDSPDTNDNLFLLPYDTRYDNISATGFPMWDIETALKRFIRAKKVVVIADACHSGGVGESFDIARRTNRKLTISPVASGLQNLSHVGDGVCVISAADDRQLSQENKRWGGGHGVFTYFLLNGLKGEADYNGDSEVTLGELIPFISETVRRETKNAQSPTVAGKFDPALTISK